MEKLYRGLRSGGVQDATGSIVQYARWLASGQPADWRESPILKEIRDYNQDDCVSAWQLADWLHERQRELGIHYQPKTDAESSVGAKPPSERIAQREELIGRLRDTLPEDVVRESLPPAKQLVIRARELLGHLVECHRRENKPVWWALFERAAMTPEELKEDFACLGTLTRCPGEPVVVRQSLVAEYQFNPLQDTKIDESSKVSMAQHHDVKPTIVDFDRDGGRIALKISNRVLKDKLGGQFPPSLSLIPDEFVSPHVIEDSIARLAEALLANGQLPLALERLLQRRPPQIKGLDEGVPLVVEGADPLNTLRYLVPRMYESPIAIQGPPGSGKTYAAAVLIADLLAKDFKVGITSNSRKAIVNLLYDTHARGADLNGAI